MQGLRLCSRLLQASSISSEISSANAKLIARLHTSCAALSNHRQDSTLGSLAQQTEALNEEMSSFFGQRAEEGGVDDSPPGFSGAAYTEGRNTTPSPSPPMPSPRTPTAAANKSTTRQAHTLDNATLTHTDTSGKARMVDVGGKPPTTRSATAAATVLLGTTAFELVAANQIAKGDVLTVAQLAGVMGAKQTSNLIPLCHPLLLSHVDVALSLDAERQAVNVTATASTSGSTGVEMEAMTAAAVASLTVYDMCKAASKGIEVTELRLLRKTGGKSRTWVRRGEGRS